jgi:rare lipoprotein A (peptidoglycan hydrolase)
MRMPTTLGLSLALLVASPAAMAKQHASAHHHPGHHPEHHPGSSIKLKSPLPPRMRSARRTFAAKRVSARHERAVQRPRSIVYYAAASLPAPDQYIAPARPVGGGQVGRAAWYGNQHVGRLTSSGELLDTVHATAAHRSLPLNSLVRVTNLQNGRSVIVRINDRGPVSRSLLIDMSPRAAAAIDMIDQGIAQVMIEPMAFAGGVGSSSR